MQTTTNGIETRYEIIADGDRPWIVFIHSLACTLDMWEPQIEHFRQRFNVLTYDVRGHGGSGAPEGPYSLEMMAGDLFALMDNLGISACHLVGLSMGGMIGQIAALSDPTRVLSLVLSSTTGYWPSEMQPTWRDRIKSSEADGMKPFAGFAVERWFTADFLNRNPSVAVTVNGWIEATPLQGFLGACHAIPKVDTRETLGGLNIPIQIIVGSEDTGTPPWMSQALKESAPNSCYIELSGLRHLCNLEGPETFNRIIDDFFAANNIKA